MARISDLTAITTVADDHVLVINDGTPTTKKITVANLKASLGVNYTKLVVLISQSGTNAPTLTILENTTGATFSTVRQAQGVYQITTLSSVFTVNKTLILANNFIYPYTVDISRTGVTNLTIGTYDGVSTSDDVLLNSSLEVRIYS
jgi:hypothetical protein